MTLPLDAIDDSGPSSTATTLGEPDQGPELESFLAARGTSARELIVSTLASLDLEATLRRGGLTETDLAALRERLVG